jgi:alpha-L-fucosidase 2
MNYAANALSAYTTCCWPYEVALPYQADANFGITAAILAMLVTDLPDPAGSMTTHTVLLGPAIPPAWAGGSVESLHLRGGGAVDFSWDQNGLVTTATLHQRSAAIRVVNMAGTVLAYKN